MFKSKVIVGDGLGKTLGFPTANLDITKDELKLESGVYNSCTFLNEKKYKSALVVQEKIWKIEVYLLDYNGPDFYDEYLKIEPLEKISELEKINSKIELKEKIAKDVAIIKNLLD